MNYCTKNITVLLLLAGMAVPFVGSFGWYYLQKRVIKKAVFEQLAKGIAKEELILLKFSAKESLKKREFKHGGQMYDIVDYKIQGDSILYWCFWDSKESMLDQKFENLLKALISGNHKYSEFQKHLLVFLNNLYCTTAGLLLENILLQSNGSPGFPTIRLWSAHLTSIFTPPEYSYSAIL